MMRTWNYNTLEIFQLLFGRSFKVFSLIKLPALVTINELPHEQQLIGHLKVAAVVADDNGVVGVSVTDRPILISYKVSVQLVCCVHYNFLVEGSEEVLAKIGISNLSEHNPVKRQVLVLLSIGHNISSSAEHTVDGFKFKIW